MTENNRVSKALEAAAKAFLFCSLSKEHSVKHAMDSSQAIIKQFLTHHLEHPEAVARAVCDSPEAKLELPTGEFSGSRMIMRVGERWELYESRAKAALQCLIEDLTDKTNQVRESSDA